MRHVAGSTGGIPDACNPLGGQGCLDAVAVDGLRRRRAGSDVGDRLPPRPARIAGHAVERRCSSPVDPKTPFNRWDGISRRSGFRAPAAVPGRRVVGGDNLPPFTDPAQSLGSDSPIILLDMTSGTRVPFFAEVDQERHADARRSATLIIRPLARLPEQPRASRSRSATPSRPLDGTDLASARAAFAAIRATAPASRHAPRASPPSQARSGGHLPRARGRGRRQERARAGVGLRHRVGPVPHQNDLTVDAHGRRCPLIGDNGREPDVQRRTAQPANTATRRTRSTTGTRSQSPTFLTNGESTGSTTRQPHQPRRQRQPDDDGHAQRELRGDHPEVRDRSGDRAAAPGDHLRPRPVRLGGSRTSTTSLVQSLAENQLCASTSSRGDWIGLTSRRSSSRRSPSTT